MPRPTFMEVQPSSAHAECEGSDVSTLDVFKLMHAHPQRPDHKRSISFLVVFPRGRARGCKSGS